MRNPSTLLAWRWKAIVDMFPGTESVILSINNKEPLLKLIWWILSGLAARRMVASNNWRESICDGIGIFSTNSSLLVPILTWKILLGVFWENRKAREESFDISIYCRSSFTILRKKLLLFIFRKEFSENSI